ncbi:GDP-mannose-dependent alpha-(1-6)-phosphatidylinositol monomannoside mannosyltransferase [Kocuria rosea]|uniref:glycosyltransferase n=1 Tax=Kocuria rosea TaxID=1275 RepID=UPI000F6BDAB9|nr:glycosyltransferase [Kocuria rosea]VEH42999.1 GDP-mannose-dependent alpha-(1-6)-phosphatidylinositol monomannoside mannosyltransferase [Kocuria rosea]
MPHTPRPFSPDDEPEAFWLPAARVLPAAAARPAARALLRSPWPEAGAAVARTLGPDPRAERQLEHRLGRARRRRPAPVAARRLAEAALSAGRVAEADRFLALVPPGTSDLAGTRARRHRHVGRISEAVVELRRAVAAGRATPGERRRLLHYEDDLRLLSGWRPALTPVVGYRPEAASVLHVLAEAPPRARGRRAPRHHSLLSATVAQGWTVTAVTRPGPVPADGRSHGPAPEVLDGVSYHRILPARRALLPTARLQQEAQALLELALRARPAVLHTTSRPGNGLVTRAVAEALGIPWVYEVRELPADRWAASRPAEAATSERHRLDCAREAEVLAAAADVVTMSRAMGERVRALTRALPAGPVPVRVALPAVDGPYLADPRPLREARRVLGLPGTARVVGAVADLVEHEGLDDLLRAAALVRADVPELLVVVVGEGPARRELERLAAELGLGDRVRFTGRVPDEHVVQYHQAFDVFVVARKDRPVTRAAAPTESVEALATGTPVVASRLPVLAETVADGITGMLTPPEEPETLATVLRMMLECPAVRRCLGGEGRRRVLPGGTWHGVAAAAAEAYDHVTGRAGTEEASA